MKDRLHKIMCLILVTLLALLIDRITKNWIISQLSLGEGFPVVKGFFDIIYVRNFGGAFSILQHQKYFFVFMGFVVPVIIVIFLKDKILQSYYYTVIIGMICGGAIGNLTDRLVYGYVIDFLQFGTFPVFNFADTFITSGVILLAAAVLNAEYRESRQKRLESRVQSDA